MTPIKLPHDGVEDDAEYKELQARWSAKYSEIFAELDRHRLPAALNVLDAVMKAVDQYRDTMKFHDERFADQLSAHQAWVNDEWNAYKQRKGMP